MVAGVARILTANATPVQEWCRDRVLWSAPLKRKCIVFRVTRPLVVPNWSDHPEYEPDIVLEDKTLPVDRALGILQSRGSCLPVSDPVVQAVRTQQPSPACVVM